MKILQLNIWGGKLGKQIIELVEREQPDIVCFQEGIMLPGDENLFVSTLTEINRTLNYPHIFFTPSWSFQLFNRNAEWGNAILSRFPFTYTHAFFTHGEFVEGFDVLGGDYNMRNLQHVIVEKNGKNLHVLNHHGHHIRQHKLGDAETMRQCGMIADYVKSLDGDVVLTGDFNLAPESESLELLNAILTNHAMVSGVTTTRTPLTHKTEVCDYIFTSKGLEASNFRVLSDIASDHAALTIDIV